MREITISTGLFSMPITTDPCKIGDLIKITIRARDATYSSVCEAVALVPEQTGTSSVCRDCFIKRINDMLVEGTAFCPRNADCSEFLCGRGYLKSVNDIMEDI